VYQLTPELAQWMAAADLVVMIDASRMTGANFSIGEQLSSIVARRIPLVSVAVRQVCANGDSYLS
jgi:hypothetical protein